MTGNPFVGTVRVGWMEFWTHLKSPRLVILIVLFALLVFGVSYGMSQTSNPFQNQTQVFSHPAILNESSAEHYLVVGWFADYVGTPQAGIPVSLYRTNFSANYSGPLPASTLVGQATTNGSGFVSFDVGMVMPDNASFNLQGPPSVSGGAGMVEFFPDLRNQTFTITMGRYSYSGPYGLKNVEYLDVLSLQGTPATEAAIYLNDTLVGQPNAYGYFTTEIAPGEQTLNVSYKGYEETFQVFGNPTSGSVYENGADAVLLEIATGFMPLILPIVAIAISFDAIARERAQGSLELLLCRRVRKEGVLTGKFLGAFGAITVPVAAVLLAGTGVVAAISGRAPTASFVVAVVLSSLFLVAVYVLLMLLLSSLAKSVGTAVVFGVVLWLFFDLLFSFLIGFLLFAMLSGPTNPGFYNAGASLVLFDPNLVFQLLVSLAIPTTNGGSGGVSIAPTQYLSEGALIVAAILWIVVPLLVTLFVFRRKAEG